MTGEELVSELLKLGPEKLKLTVVVEGCDCNRSASGVTVYDDASLSEGQKEIHIESSDDRAHY